MKLEAKVLHIKALDSLFLSIDHFNRPYDRGRPEAVLLFMDRAFELLLKAVIVHKGGKIIEKGESLTIGFEKCVRKCLSEGKLKCLTEEEAFTIQTINSLRDAAQHYMVSVSEQQLYLYAQAGLTLFKHLLEEVFGDSLNHHFPDRVLPVTTSPPYDLATLIDLEFEDIQALVRPGKRKILQAHARLRALAITEASLAGERSQPSQSTLRQFVKRIRDGEGWQSLFPGIASLRLETSGTGLNVSLRITKSEGEPIRLVPEGTPGATIVGVKRVNELDFYNLGLYALAKKVGLTPPKTLAVIRALALQDDEDYFKEIKIGRVVHKRYSQHSIKRIKDELPDLDMDEVWREHRPVARK